ncbi:TPA: hypothetical protein DCY67_05095 [Candidatus Acetothermia bacterium]|nr:hypothetical protein [Candidatus Acetothermia bacterium]
MRRFWMACVLIVLGGALAWGQYFYAFYYDRSGGQDLEINLLNTMPDPTEVVITAYDAYGKLLWSLKDTMEGYVGAFVQLVRYVPEGKAHWGVVTVESEERLVIGLEYLVDGDLASVDHISQTVPELAPEEHYWLGAYWTQVGDASTGLIVMNPWDEPVACFVTVYRQDGEIVYEGEFLLNPHEASFLDLEDELGHGPFLWGLVDVEMAGKAVVVAVEYYSRGLKVDNITQYYF